MADQVSTVHPLNVNGRIGVFAINAAANEKSLFVVTTERRLAQASDTDGWNLQFPAEAAGHAGLRFQSGVAVFPTNAAANKKAIYVVTTEGRLAQLYDDDQHHWRLDFPAEAAGHAGLRFQSGIAVFPTDAAANKKAIYAITTDGRLAQLWDTNRWNLDFPAERGGQAGLRFQPGLAVYPREGGAKKSIYAVTTDGRLAQVWDTNRWNLEFIPIDKSAGNYILPSRIFAGMAKQEKSSAGVVLGTGFDIVTGERFGSPFAGPLKLVKTTYATTTLEESCEVVSSADQYRKVLAFEATGKVDSPTISVTADVSWLSRQEINSTSLAVVAQEVKCGEEWQPDLDQALAIDLSQFTSYSDFVARYGTHFVGGYVTGTSYTALYRMECTTKFEAHDLSVALNAKWNWSFSADISAKIDSAIRSSHTSVEKLLTQNPENWPDSAPPLKEPTDEGIVNNMATLRSLKSDQLTGPIRFVSYPWTQLSAIANCVWAQKPAIDINLPVLDRNLQYVSLAITDLKYARDSATAAIKKQLYEDPNEPNKLATLNQTLSNIEKDLDDLEKLLMKSGNAAKDLSHMEIDEAFRQRYGTAGMRYTAEVDYIAQPSRTALKNQDGNYSSELTSNVWVIGERKDLHVEYKIPTGYRKVDFKTTKSNQWGNSDGSAAWDEPEDPTNGHITLHAWADPGSKVTITVSDVMAAKNPRTV